MGAKCEYFCYGLWEIHKQKIHNGVDDGCVDVCHIFDILHFRIFVRSSRQEKKRNR